MPRHGALPAASALLFLLEEEEGMDGPKAHHFLPHFLSSSPPLGSHLPFQIQGAGGEFVAGAWLTPSPVLMRLRE